MLESALVSSSMVWQVAAVTCRQSTAYQTTAIESGEGDA
jgi:hypothetical protein